MAERATSRDSWGPATGVAFIVLLLVAQFLTSTPNDKASGAKVISYYLDASNKRTAFITAALIDLSVVVGLFFFGYLRDWLRQSDIGNRLAPIAFAGAIIFAVSGVVSAGLTFALTDVPKQLTPASAQTLNLLSGTLGFAATSVGVAVLTLATSIVILRSRLLPAWFGWFGVVIAVVAVAGPLGAFAFPAVGLWTLILVGFLARRPALAPSPTLRGAPA